MLSMELFDTHMHLFAQGYAGRYGALGEGAELKLYGAMRREHEIERSLVVGYEGEAAYAGNNEYILQLAAQHDWMLPLCFVPAGECPARGWMTDRAERGAYGISLYLTAADAVQAVAEWPIDFWRELAGAGAMVSVNIPLRLIARLQPVIEKAEGVYWLISHCGLPGEQAVAASPDEARAILHPLLDLARLPTVGVKLSALYAISSPASAYPHAAAGNLIAALRQTFGGERLCWGSDFSPALQFVSFEQTIAAVTALLPDTAERNAIFSGQFIRHFQRNVR